MAKQQQQQAHRRKLHSEKQIGARIRRRRIPTPLNYGRETILTVNQQAWARAFTTSLSGWRSRQKFYKDHLEAEIQAEREAIATEAAYGAERLAQSKANEQEGAERKAMQQAQEEEEKAEAWAHKAWEMHKAGRGVRRWKYEYYGWDPEEEEYPRDLKTERLLARTKARRMAARRAELLAAGENPDDTYDTDKVSDLDNSDYEGSAGPGNIDLGLGPSRSPPGSPSRSSPQPAPVIERAPVVDWREKVRAGVIKKKLSITKTWGAITWNQKSNIQERLLVLEDDGYDISDLLDGKASSEDVTNIVLARAAGEQPPVPRAAQPLVQPGPPSSPQGEAQELPADWLEAEMLEKFLGPAAEDSPPRSPSGSPSPSPASLAQQPDEEPGDHTQPFSFDEPYHPQSSRHLKRKRDDEDDAGFEEELALSSPVQKKRKVQRVTEDELAAQALQKIKRAVLCGVFRSARILGRKLVPSSRIVFTVNSPSISATEEGPRYSSVSYMYPKRIRCAAIKPAKAVDDKSSTSSPEKQDAKEAEPMYIATSYSISKRALDCIMAELRFLTNATEGGDTIQMFDPDYDEDLLYTASKSEERIQQNIRKMQRQELRITVTSNSEGQEVFQGDAMVLAELLKMLRGQAILYHADWEWDRLRLRRSNDLAWSLSPQTQDTFVEIERILKSLSELEEIEIVVGVVNSA